MGRPECFFRAHARQCYKSRHTYRDSCRCLRVSGRQSFQPNEEVYIGEGKRDKIHHINGKLAFEKLTSTAKSELEHALHEPTHLLGSQERPEGLGERRERIRLVDDKYDGR